MSQLSTLGANVRLLLQEAAQDYFNSGEIRQGIGEAYRHYCLIMMDEGEGYFETTENIGFTANTPTISLASLSQPFFRISAVERNLSNGSYPLEKNERRRKPNYTFMIGAGDGYRPKWKLRGNNIVLEPTPTATEAASATTGLKVDYVYIPTFPTSASADSFTFDAGFATIYEPMIEIYTAIYMVENKLGNNSAFPGHDFSKRLAKWEKIFWDSLERDEAPETIEFEGVDYSNPYL